MFSYIGPYLYGYCQLARTTDATLIVARKTSVGENGDVVVCRVPPEAPHASRSNENLFQTPSVFHIVRSAVSEKRTNPYRNGLKVAVYLCFTNEINDWARWKPLLFCLDLIEIFIFGHVMQKWMFINNL